MPGKGHADKTGKKNNDAKPTATASGQIADKTTENKGAPKEPLISIPRLAFVVAVVAALGTVWQAWVSNDTEHRQLRAYAGLEKIDFETPNIGDPQYRLIPDSSGRVTFTDFIKLSVRNYGATPASNVWIGFSAADVTPLFGLLPDDFQYPMVDPPIGFPVPSFETKQVVEPGTTVLFFAPANDITMGKLRKAQSKQVTTYFYGFIEYTDIYNRTRRHLFCWEYEPWRVEGERFVPYKKHNEEEDVN